MQPQDDQWMDCALAEARLAEAAGEVPVGAVLVVNGQLLAATHNRPIGASDPTAHAELLAIRQAAQACGNYRLTGATLYATMEPCAMCAGALVNARIERLVFGARDLRFGGVRSKFRIADSGVLNHSVEVVEGVRAAECTAILKAFFEGKRA
jgi:tRNA(adenine34) deaminase